MHFEYIVYWCIAYQNAIPISDHKYIYLGYIVEIICKFGNNRRFLGITTNLLDEIH